jgi:hypothetical protein
MTGKSETTFGAKKRAFRAPNVTGGIRTPLKRKKRQDTPLNSTRRRLKIFCGGISVKLIK